MIETRFGEPGGRERTLLLKAAIEVVPVDTGKAEVARSAFRRFGKGRHAEGLNYGDSVSHALSPTSGEPLLVKGADFGQTDLRSVFLP